MNDIDPPAQVKPAATLAELAGQVRLMQKQHVRTSLEQAREIGVVLRAAKEECVREGKSWLAWLKEAKVSRQTGSRYMRIAEHWSLLVDYDSLVSHGGVIEAINFLAGKCEDEQEIFGQNSPNGQAGQGSTSPPKPWPDDNRCRDCRTRGRNDADCEACREKNAPPPPAPPQANGKAEPPATWAFCPACREKGSVPKCSMCRLVNGRAMTPEEEAEHHPDPETPKPPPSLVKKLEKAYATLWGVYRAIGKQFGLAIGKSVDDPENHPAMKAMIAAHAELKERTKKFIWEHQRKRQKRQHK